jgi:RNA polymerase sigma-70 factor (ECF subfamily)
VNPSPEPSPQLPAEPFSATFARHGAGLRALARTLLGDEISDDAVQETWLRLLEAPPAERSSLGGWFATVLRRNAANLRRSDARRRARESDAARDERIDTDGLREREEILRSVTAAVLSLHAPYRAVVILRWFEGLPPREIAARLGVEATVIHTRLSRAHAQLRRRLEREHGEGRWRAMLGLLAGPNATEVGAAAATSGVSVMSANAVIAAVAAALLVGVSLWRVFAERDGRLSKPSLVAETFESAAASRGAANAKLGAIESDAASQREAVDAQAANSPSTDALAWPEPELEYSLEVSVSDVFDRPASVGLLAAPAGHMLNRVARTDANGHAQVRWRAFVAQMELDLAIDGEAELRRVQLVAGAHRIALRSRAAPTPLVRPFADDASDPERVAAAAHGLSIDRLRTLHNVVAGPAGIDADFDVAGRVRFVEPSLPGFAAPQNLRALPAPVGDPHAFEATSRLRPSTHAPDTGLELGRVRGRLTNPDGSAAAQVTVGWRAANSALWFGALSDENGLYEAPCQDEGDALIQFGGGDAARLSARVSVAAGTAHTFDAVLERGLELRGRLVDSAGEPLSGWRVEIEAVDEALADATVSDERGRFAAPNLPSGPLKILVAPTNGPAPPPAILVSERVYAGEPEVAFTVAATANEPLGALRVHVPNSGTARRIEYARAWRLDSWRGVAGDVIPPADSDAIADQPWSVDFSRLTPGVYRIEALAADGEQFALDDVCVRSSDRLELDFLPAPGSSEVHFELEDHRGVELELTRRGASVELHRRVRVEGPSTLRIPAGEWRVIARRSGLTKGSHVAVLSGESTTVTF